MRIFVIAGEASGDNLGAPIVEAALAKGYDLRGVGGDNMESKGLRSLFPMTELSLMGIAEILPHIPNLLKRINETVKAIKDFKPDLVLTIDAPDFCKRVVKKARAYCSDTKFVHYVAPNHCPQFRCEKNKNKIKMSPFLKIYISTCLGLCVNAQFITNK